MQQITEVYGFNQMRTNGSVVQGNEQIFLRRNGIMIPLGTFDEAALRAGYGNDNLVGIDGTIYGRFSTPAIVDNLFVNRPNYSQVLSSAVTGRQVNRVGASNIISYLGPDNVDNYVFRKGHGVRKSKRANKRTHKKQRTNRRKGRK
jgi:hypothetical protein